MNCYHHLNEVGVALCVDCGKSLCHACASQHTPVRCKKCAIRAFTKAIFKELMVFLISAIIYKVASAYDSMPYAWMSIPWGFMVINSLLYGWGIVLPGDWYVGYLFLKLMGACIIGVIVFPLRAFYGLYIILKNIFAIVKTIRFSNKSFAIAS